MGNRESLVIFLGLRRIVNMRRFSSLANTRPALKNEPYHHIVHDPFDRRVFVSEIGIPCFS